MIRIVEKLKKAPDNQLLVGLTDNKAVLKADLFPLTAHQAVAKFPFLLKEKSLLHFAFTCMQDEIGFTLKETELTKLEKHWFCKVVPAVATLIGEGDTSDTTEMRDKFLAEYSNESKLI